MKIKNENIVDARMALAKIANAELPLPLVVQIAPVLDVCDPVIRKVQELTEGGKKNEEQLGNYLGGSIELPPCSIPALPNIAMNYLEYKALEGIIKIEEVG